MKARTLLVILAAAVVLALTPAAKAGCIPAPLFCSFDLASGSYTYFAFGNASPVFDPNPAAPTGGLIGRLWAPGNRSGVNEGTACPLNTWLFQSAPEYPGYPNYYINGGMGGSTLGEPCDNVGCANNSPLIVVVEGTGHVTRGTAPNTYDVCAGYVMASKSIETPAMAASWNYYEITGGNTTKTLAPIPKPYVLNSARDVTYINASMAMRHADVSAAALPTEGYSSPTDVITGMKIYRYKGNAVPGCNRADWAAQGTVWATVTYTGTDVPITDTHDDCADGLNTYYAASLVFDGGQYESTYVSEYAKINCTPGLAQPGKFKKIDRKPHGRK